MQHAVLLGRDSRMRFNNRSYRSLPPRPLDHRMFDELEYPTMPRKAYRLMP